MAGRPLAGWPPVTGWRGPGPTPGSVRPSRSRPSTPGYWGISSETATWEAGRRSNSSTLPRHCTRTRPGSPHTGMRGKADEPGHHDRLFTPTGGEERRSGALPVGRDLRMPGTSQEVPPPFFAPDVSAEVVGNLIFGIFETDGYVSREQTGGLRVGFSTTSEQLAQQLHWLLLRWGIGSSVQQRDPHAQRGGLTRAGGSPVGTRPGRSGSPASRMSRSSPGPSPCGGLAGKC